MLHTRKVKIEKIQPKITIQNPSYKSSHLKVLEVFQRNKGKKLTFKEISAKSGLKSTSRTYKVLRYLHFAGKINIEKVTGHWMGKGKFRYNYYLAEDNECHN